MSDRHTLEVRLEGILGRLHALLGLEPDEAELILDIVDHDGLTLTTLIVSGVLSGRVGTLQLEILAALLEVLAAVALVEDSVNLLDVEGIGEDLVPGHDILYFAKSPRQQFVCLPLVGGKIWPH